LRFKYDIVIQPPEGEKLGSIGGTVMALLKCPECGKEISDKAENCPHCGYVLVKNELPKIRRTELTRNPPKPVPGVICIALGAFMIFGGLLTIVAIFGIFVLIAGIAFLTYGVNLFVGGSETGTCPYCGNTISTPRNFLTYKCPCCKKTSTHRGNFLETIE